MNTQKQTLEDAYWEFTLLHEGPPKSVFALCKHFKLKEADFYRQYASLDALENRFWESNLLAVTQAIEADEDYASYPNKQKLLAFYYTFFEHILPYRSRYLARFPRKLGSCTAKRLRLMENAFAEFIGTLDVAEDAHGSMPKLSGLQKLEKKGLWLHFLSVIRFYLGDESSAFADTDALIEKSVNLAWDVKEANVLNGAFDLLRFLKGRT